MKKYLPFLIVLVVVLGVGAKLLPPKNSGPYDIVGFGQLPVLQNGRFKPLHTVARNSLLQFQGRQRVVAPDGRELTPGEWLMDVTFHADLADTYQTFEIVHPEVLAIFDLNQDKGLAGKRFSFQQMDGKLAELERQAKLAFPVESAVRTTFQRAVVQLYANLLHYQRLKYTLVGPGHADFLGDLLKFQENLLAGIAAIQAREAKQPYDEKAFTAIVGVGEVIDAMSKTAEILVIPPESAEADPTAWQTAGTALLDTFKTKRVSPAALAYAGLAHAWRLHQPEQFNQLIKLYRADLAKRFAPQLAKAQAETRFNVAEPFYNGLLIFAFAAFLAIFSWLAWPETLGRTAFWLVALGWIISTGGIVTRMWLEGRPPVTNLYSSALFIGWGAVALCLVLEYLYRNAIGSVAAGFVGFSTLFIAHYLQLSGDTLEMMRAVLDSNFWLATHVVIVSIGYASTFLAGFLALIYIFRGLFTRSLDKATADALTRMVYGIVCFATLFSFTGTVLGGIWADQSWGRFWGWDPKENGALIIVVWNAIVLHARWGGMIKQRGLMCLAVGGNIVTSWSWFGTNMLGVGLHSYGFTDAAFVVLTTFVGSQLAIIALANLPLKNWRSFQRDGETRGPTRPGAAAPAR